MKTKPAASREWRLQRRPAGIPLRRLAAPAIAIIPLRLFIGITFVDAGGGKLLSPAYFGSGPQSFAALARSFARDTPLSGLIHTFVLPHPLPVAVLIAAAELTVGVLTLIGLATRIAAAVGLLLSLSFFLTASWHTHPYFYGSDLPFACGWLVLLLAGTAGLPSVDRRLSERARGDEGLPDGTPVAVPFGELQRLCAAADTRGGCAAAGGRPCSGVRCALVRRDDPVEADTARRALLESGVLAGIGFGLAAMIGGVAAVVSRAVGTGGGANAPRLGGAGPATTTTRAGAAGSGSGGSTNAGSGSGGAPAGATVLGKISQIPVGEAATFTVPSSGDPGIAVRLATTHLVGFDAVCPHAGCTVGYDPSSKLLVCPCHGSEFNPAQNAAVVLGPSPAPLTPVPLGVSADGTVYIR